MILGEQNGWTAGYLLRSTAAADWGGTLADKILTEPAKSLLASDIFFWDSHINQRRARLRAALLTGHSRRADLKVHRHLGYRYTTLKT